METIELTQQHKRILLHIARKTIENVTKGNKIPSFNVKDPVLETRCGAFVTIHKNSRLRGCIGNIVGRAPLWQTVRDMAIEAALNDPRFPPVSSQEIEDIEIEISVLSPLKKIEDINEIEVGKHGILIKRGFYQGLLLPQVATEYNWDRITFLEQTCYKAGLDKDCWKGKNCEIYIFSANVFSEKDLNGNDTDK
ncbi:MAG: AmmeMemoRadiSam system protein A [Actinobacteria bacterium]|nr:AmmeMemoRadiSam system protein A [Actinomycetota bacterium]